MSYEVDPYVIDADPTKPYVINEYTNIIGRVQQTTTWKLPNGKVHRVDGPAVICDNGTKQWWRNGLLHREEGPAVVGDYLQEWWVKGKRHRINGPAVKCVDERVSWYLNGDRYTFDKWRELTPISDEEKIMMKLQYG